jgi:outer membrane protein TolC
MNAARAGNTGVALSLALALAGCATFSGDGGFGPVAAMTKERTGIAPQWQRSAADVEAAQVRVRELLAVPLTADAAVELALLNNAGLQASFQALRIGEADLVRAGRMRNPTLSFGNIAGGGIREIERAVIFDVLALLTLPLATDFEQRRFEQTQLKVAGEAVAVAAEARRAYFAAVASQEQAIYAARAREAADASAELARRMVRAGNYSKLAQMREQTFYADTTVQLARAQHQALADRERLLRAVGMTTDVEQLKLPARLPDLPVSTTEPRDAERTAIERRLDVLQAKRAAEAVARSLELTRATGFINVLHAGYANKSQTGEARQDGYAIELELPLFDFGAARNARAEATYMQAVQRTAEVAVNARSQVREAYSAYRTAYDSARHYRDELVPLRQRIADENLLRYNGMLISVFDLLADARDQVTTVTAAIEASRDFWLAETDLQIALAGGAPAGASPASRPTAATQAADRAGH